MRDIAPYARTAFAQGWAASGGPMTERVKAGCRAAVALAVERAHDPDILEVTLKLGQLEGTWALVYDRREQVYDAHISAIAALWRRAAARVDLQLAVHRFRDSLGLSVEAVGDGDHREMVARAVAAAVAATIVGQDSHPADRDDLIAAIVAALRAGYAEGMAGALAVSAEEDDSVDDVDIDAAYDIAYAEIGDDQRFHHEAVSVLAQLQQAIAKQLARILAGGDSLTFDELVDRARHTIGAAGVATALAVLIDFAIGRMVTAGTLALYRRYHVEEVAFLTAGDDNVCPVCEDAENSGPYRRDEAPEPPLHPRCRCALVATGELPDRAYIDLQ